MAYDEDLAERIREALASRKGVTERKMFGGIAFMVDGNMATGVMGDELIVRLGGDLYEKALKHPSARPMVMGTMTAKGMVLVAPAGVGSKAALSKWVDLGVDYSGSLPAKTPKKKPPAKKKR